LSPFSLFLTITFAIQGNHTKKAGIVGKYGTRYGGTLRKVIKKMEVTQHSKYVCTFCGKNSVKRQATGIWKCTRCKKTMAGGSYVLSTAAAITVRTAITRLQKAQAAAAGTA
jgi:large subunit ribosomal protein L37Ae